MDHTELSEIAFGLVWEGRKSPMEISPEILASPYDEALEILRKKNGTREDVAKKISPDFLNKASYAIKNMNGLGEDVDWVQNCRSAWISLQMGTKLKKVGSKLERNEEVDLLPIFGELQSVVAGHSTGLSIAKDIDFSNYKPFQKSGFSPWDMIVGNFPMDGPIVAFGKTGVGKSHWGSMIVNQFLHQHKKKTAAVYTLEMAAEHWMFRETNMYPSIEDLVNDRLYVSGSVKNVEELVAEVSTRRLDMVLIDDMDNLVTQNSADEYERIYRRIKEICRFLTIPVIVLAQPNREAKKMNRFLTQYDIAWSGAAENSAACLIALQELNALDVEEGYDAYPLDDENRHYMIFLKSRDGWPEQQGPGAIRLEPSKTLWEGKVWQDRLWMAYSARSTIGKKKIKKS